MCDHVSLHVSNVVYTICIARMYSKPTKAHDNNKPEAGGGGGELSQFLHWISGVTLLRSLSR